MEKSRKGAILRMSAAGLLVVPLALGACTGDDEVPTVEPPSTAEASPEIGDITDDYFGDASYVGRTVTVQGVVTREVGPSSFVLDGRRYGDDTLLVISAPAIDAEVGEQVEVTGVVRQFDYEIYENGYGLSNPGLYGGFDGEEVLVAGEPGASASAPAPEPSRSAG